MKSFSLHEASSKSIIFNLYEENSIVTYMGIFKINGEK